MEKPSIRTVAARQKLPPQREPYWERLANGCHIGYRSVAKGAGTWIARWYDPEARKKHLRALGEHVDYDAAVKAARQWFAQNEMGASPKATTVAEACKAYVDHIAGHKSAVAAKDAERRFTRLIYGKPIGKINLDKLKTTDLQKWMKGQVAGADDEETERRAKDSANRNLASFKAALNFALKGRLVATDAGWKTVEKFPKVGRRREHFLTLEDRRRLLAACQDDIRQLVTAMLLTGARPGELAEARASDFDGKQGTLALHHRKGQGKDGRRVCTLSTEAVQFFTQAGKGKIGQAYLLTRANGKPWSRDYWKDPFKEAALAAGLPDDVVLYSVRHSAISELIAGGMDSHVVARLAGTSTDMIDKHYGHLRHDKTRAKLDAVQML